MVSFHKFEKILEESRKVQFDPDKVVLSKNTEKNKEDKPKLKAQSAGTKKGGGNKNFINKNDDKNCECECFPCSKLKKCENCSCKNCKCKGCKCYLNNKIIKNNKNK